MSDLTTRQFERTQFVRCYTLGHAWFDYDNSSWVPQWGVPLVVRCERCGSERHDTIDVAGHLSARSYDYPQGYKYGKGQRPTRDEFRLMLLETQRHERRRKKRTAS